MTDETLDPRFERDLRAVLGASEPADVPASLYALVANVPRRAPARLAWGSRRMVFAGLAMAAVVVIAAAAAAVALRPFGNLPIIGGPATPAPTQPRSLHLEYGVPMIDGALPGPKDMAAVVAVLRARLDATGVAGSTITTGADGSISLDVNVDPTDEAAVTELRQLLGTTGRLDFVPLGDQPASVGEQLDPAAHPPLFSGDQVAGAKLGSDQTGARTVDFTLRPEGARLFADYTAASIGTYFAIVLDGVVISAPVIQSAIPGGEVQITQGGLGGYPLAEARRLIAILGSGALPFPIFEVSNNAGPAPSDLLASAPPAPDMTASPQPSTTTGADDVLIAAARAHSAAVGIALAADALPVVTDAQPSFDDVLLRLVSLPLADPADAALQVYFDGSGRVVVVDDSAGVSRPTGPDVSRDGALQVAARQFRLVGVDPSDGTLTVVEGAPGGEWNITLVRVIDGHPVANTPAMWRIAGDRAYVNLRSDGTLLELYAIRPSSEPAPPVLATDVLDAGLATVSGLSAKELASLHPALAWVRAKDPVTGMSAPTLSLGYCATKALPNGWSGWCVDAGTGQQSVVDGGID